MKLKKNLKRIEGDASLRIFFRKKNKDSSSIIVFCKREKKKNLLIYDSINKILLKNDILAPKLLSQNYSKNFIEITDFGNKTVFDYLKQNRINKLVIFKRIIILLSKIQKIKDKKIINFKKKIYHIPKYYPKTLLEEARLFSNWYAFQSLSRTNHLNFKKKFNKIINNLIKKLYFKNNVFVHRDFHVSNLMLVNKTIGVIDTQDALIGNKVYDLASLIDDVRFKTSNKFKENLLNYYLKNQKKKDRKKLKNDFEIISILRNLKIIGIFSRLAIRDNKKKYLKLIPYAWSLIKLRSKNNDKFIKLNSLLENFKKD